jgi:threonine synthase
MWRYRPFLPLENVEEAVTLGEGQTPLLRAAPRAEFNGVEVLWKNETTNPTGSHKDRAESVAVSVALARDARTVFVASAGSTGLAAAAYAARAGLHCVVLVGADASDRRLLPIRMTGARVVRAGANIDDVLDVIADLARTDNLIDLSTWRRGNPWQTEGPKTIAFEIVEQLGHVPDVVVVPIGGGGTIASVHRGFEQLRDLGETERVPRMIGTQPVGYETLVVALRTGLVTQADLRAGAFKTRPATVQVKTAHTFAPDGAEALVALRSSGGSVLGIDDAAALDGCLDLASRDGIWAEPSSGVVVPAIRRAIEDGVIAVGETVVGIVCGNGFRELDATEPGVAPKLEPIETLRADPRERLLELASLERSTPF